MAKSNDWKPSFPAKGKAITSKNPVSNMDSTGNFPSPTVPDKPGQLHGFGPIDKPFRRSHVPGVHGYGHVGRMKLGHLRLSGYANAHRLGANPIKAKTAPKVGK